MTFELVWLPEVLEAVGLKVAEVTGWRDRGRGPMGQVAGVMCHHTATITGGNMPTLSVLSNGRPASSGTPALAGPLAHLGLGRDGTFYVVAAGRCNHAGKGSWQGVTSGNSSFIGIEAENGGRPADLWPEVQLEAYARGVAAILTRLGAPSTMCCGHKEYALPAGRKIDPSFLMAPFRARVETYMSGKTPPALIPAKSATGLPTLRRGMACAEVGQLQQALGVSPSGSFDSTTESAVREWQRRHSLVPDGIFGPKSWAGLKQNPSPSISGPALVVATPTMPVSLPMADDAAHPVQTAGLVALSPDGQGFARFMRRGLVTRGVTPLTKFLQDSSPLPGLSASVQRVISAVSLNEGYLEAVNSWDGAHLSFGLFQWTAGMNGDGELAALLVRFKALDASAFNDCLGRYGLDAKVAAPKSVTGQIAFNGKVLASDADKEVLREAVWAYRFWRAGHHPSMRRAQVFHAAARIAQFIDLNASGAPICRWFTSEHGIALILDEHVNRPGHVPKTLEQALLKIDNGRLPDPSSMQDDDEARLIKVYLAQREGTMTDSQKRAATIASCVSKGALFSQRSSFKAA